MPLVEAGKAVPMMSWGVLDANGDIVRDPTFPDIPTFKEVCTATAVCETSGDAWEAWKAFFIAGFPAQKMVFLPQGAPQEALDTYQKAFEAVIAHPDFKKLSEARLGIYPQLTGKQAVATLKLGTQVDPKAKTFVKNWLVERYGVKLN